MATFHLRKRAPYERFTMKLFSEQKIMTKVAHAPLEKTADTKLSENSEHWPQEIQDQVVRQLPSTSKKRIFVDVTERDDSRGFAKGEVVVDGKMTIPFFVRDFKMTPLDVVVHKGKSYAATRKKIMEILYTNRFADRLSDKTDKKLTSMQQAAMSPLAQAIGLLDTDYFLSGKMASDFNYVIDAVDGKSGYRVNYMDRFNKTHHETYIPKFASKNFFQTMGIDHIEASEKIANEGTLLVSFSKRHGRMEEIEASKFASDLKFFNKTSFVRVYDRNGKDHYDGIYFQKTASSSTGTIEDRPLFLSGNGYCSGKRISGSSLPYQVDLEKMASEPEKGDRGFLICNAGGVKLAFGPIKFLSDKSRVVGMDQYKIADDNFGTMNLKFDHRKTRPVFLESSGTVIFPDKVAFVRAGRELPISQDVAKMRQGNLEKNYVKVSFDGAEYSLKIASDRIHQEGKFDNRAKVVNELADKGIDPALTSLVLDSKELEKRDVLAKLVWDKQKEKVTVEEQVEAAVPNGLQPGGGSSGKIQPKSLEKFASIALIKDPVANCSAYNVIDRMEYENFSADKELASKIAGEIKCLVEAMKPEVYKLAAASPSLNKTVVDVLMLDDKNFDMDRYFEAIPELEKVENLMSSLLLEVRAGRKSLPETTLSNLVRSIGVVRDSLEVLRETSL